MACLVFRCPKTGREIESDIAGDRDSASLVRMFSVRLRCPWCGETHDCRVVDGRAPGRELSARGAAVPPSKSVSPPG